MSKVLSNCLALSLLCLMAIAGCGGGVPASANRSDYDDNDPPPESILKDKKGNVVQEKVLKGRPNPVGHGN